MTNLAGRKRFLTLEQVCDIVGGFEMTEFAVKFYRIEFADGTPSFPISALPFLMTGMPHDLVDIRIADRILDHWEDYNIPPIPQEALK
jgi:hypothetical protein